MLTPAQRKAYDGIQKVTFGVGFQPPQLQFAGQLPMIADVTLAEEEAADAAP